MLMFQLVKLSYIVKHTRGENYDVGSALNNVGVNVDRRE